MSESLTARFAQSAASAGWPEELIQQISIQIDTNSVDLVYDSQLQKQIHDLEYGHLSAPPTAVIRNFGKTVTPDLEETLLEKVFYGDGDLI